MTVTSYGVNDPLAVKLWSKRLSVEVLKNTWASKFMGETSSSIIQIKDETSKGAGDKITYGLRMQLSGLGVIGDAGVSRRRKDVRGRSARANQRFDDRVLARALTQNQDFHWVKFNAQRLATNHE